jgi:hypothetical protein
LALEALAALVHVPSTQVYSLYLLYSRTKNANTDADWEAQRFFDEQGVVEMAVRMARRGGMQFTCFT